MSKVEKASKAPGKKLAAKIPSDQTIRDTLYTVKVLHAASLSKPEKTAIFDIFEVNMRELYEKSTTFSWDPPTKRLELFDSNSRFILVSSLPTDLAPSLLAYTMFRFEDEMAQNELYCYELQVTQSAHKRGLGRFLVEQLITLAKIWGMDVVKLTVLKENKAARQFYEAMEFEVDPESPYTEPDDSDQEEYDYEIISKDIQH